MTALIAILAAAAAASIGFATLPKAQSAPVRVRVDAGRKTRR